MKKILFGLFGCGRPPLDKPAINHLKSESLQAGQLDTIYRLTNAFPNNIQIAFALIKNGQTTFYGVNRINDTLISIQNSNSAFEIGSITKVFTTTILANFVINGNLKLDDKINPIWSQAFSDENGETWEWNW